MTTVNDLIDEIKIGCPELSDSIENIRGNIHHKTRSKILTKKKSLPKPAPKKPSPKKPSPKKPAPKKNSPKPDKQVAVSDKLQKILDARKMKQEPKPAKHVDDKEPDKEPDKEQDLGIPFSSIKACGHVNFTDKNIQLIRKTSFLKKTTSTKFTKIETDPDGNCGYHGLLQGLFETYYLLGDKTNDYLKKFIKEIKEKLQVDPKEIVANNRRNNYITIPREIINHFRRFILDLIDPKKKMPDGSSIHYFERDDEVPHFIWDDKKEKYSKKRKPVKSIKENIKKNNEIYANIEGGITDTSSILKVNWLREEVIARLIIIFGISIHAYLTYTDRITDRDFITLVPNSCEGIKNCGHIIFMVNNGNHFTYLKTDIQGYDENILKCLGVDEVKSDGSSDSSSDSSLDSASDNNSDVDKLLNMGFIKDDIIKVLKTNNFDKALDILLKKQKNSDPVVVPDLDLGNLSSSSSSSKKSKKNSKNKSKKKPIPKSPQKNKSRSHSSNRSKVSLNLDDLSDSNNSNTSPNLSRNFSDFSINSSSDKSNKESKSISNTSDLNKKYNYKKNPRLYEKELYKLILKKFPNSPETDIKKEYEARIDKLKSNM